MPATADQTQPQSTSRAHLRRLLALGFQYRRECLAVVTLQFLIVGLSLGGLGLTGLGIDFLRTTVDPSSPAPTWPLGMAPPAEWSPQRVIWAIAGIVLASAMLNAVIRWAAAISAANLSQKILLNLRAGVFEKLQRL